jgi:transcription-repair coupling factor (superfamily II helicase)
MLEDAVKKEKGHAVEDERLETQVDLRQAAHLPEGYIPDLRSRVDAYRRLARARDLQELEALETELKDRYGPLPPAASAFVKVCRLKRLAGRCQLIRVAEGDEVVVLSSTSRKHAELLRARDRQRIRLVEDTTLHVHKSALKKNVLDSLLEILG